jgi:Na+/phosphate symporter
MDGFNIVMVIAIILFARLGVRLVKGYIKMKEDKKEKEDDQTL